MTKATEVDVSLRDQIYYEAVKEYEGNEQDKRNEELVAAIVAVLAALGIKDFTGLSKSKLTIIISTVKEVVLQQTRTLLFARSWITCKRLSALS
jgi:hypothetical protein